MSSALRACGCGLVVVAAALLQAGLEARDPQPGSAADRLRHADALFAEARYDEAHAAYRAALEAGDQDLHARAATGLVLSLLRVGDFQRAHREAAALRERDPDHPTIIALDGEALWARGLFEAAEAAFEASVARDPAQARARHGIARSLAARSRLQEAAAEAERAMRLEPEEPQYHHTIGYIHERLGRFEGAVAGYTRYIELLERRGEGPDQRAAAAWRIRFLQSFAGRRPVEIGAGGAAESWTLPVRIKDDKVYVRARINRGTYWLVLDTGADQTVVSRELAAREGIQPVSHVRAAGIGEAGVRGLQLGRIDLLQIGDLTVRNVPCLIKTPSLRSLRGREPDGLSPLALGLSMRIDYERRQLVLARALPPEPFTHRLPLRMHRLALVGGTLNGTLPVAFALDTGGEVISISHATAGLLEPRGRFRRIPLRVYGTSGWDKDAFLLPNVDLELQTLRFSGIPVVVLDLGAPSALLGFHLGGMLGHRFLSKYSVTIDLARSVVELRS